ncbi:UNVERIFIED_CONTAM: hypothetical protein RMT77_003736 [Armadillidium vulgare]
MEDASKEFQIFLSPMRDYQQPYREATTPKHRVVPVINKIVSCSSSSSSSSFTLNQRKCSVYKAVSGVSFQDTDVAEKKPVSKREKKDKKRERRQSYATPTYDFEKHHIPPPVPGTRRSKSLTSMESALNMSGDSNKNLPEITHPFTPVIIHTQSSGRKSRYSRVKDRKRSASQVRNGVETKKHDASYKMDELPVRPRRSRSASRSRQLLPSTLISDDSSCNSSLVKDTINKNKGKLPYRKVNSAERIPHITKQCQDITSHLGSNKNFKSEDIDFSVNESDWRKYDVIVTEKLDSLLKKKEEPEGGYFSLEREEAEELEHLDDNGEHFERENSSEAIYIAQAVSKEGKLNDIHSNDIHSKYDQYTIEEIYSEVPFSNQGQEVGFVDDEGLYEEIFFDKSNDINPTIFSNASYGETTPISIKVTPEVDNYNNTQSMPKVYKDIMSPKIEKSSSSTIVYIGGEDKASKDINSESSSVPLKHSSSCNNLIPRSCDNISDKRLSFIDVNDKPRFDDDHRENRSGWCGCQTRSDSQFSHSASCIKSRSGILSGKCSFIDAQKIEDKRHPETFSKLNEFLSTPSKDEDSSNTETDYELCDIDLDMFAPKTVNEDRLHLKNRENMLRSSSEAHLNHQHLNPISFSSKFSKSTLENLPKSKDIISPKTFKGFLEDSIFNPPDSESPSDENEDLILKENQIVTCISDSDSSSSSSSSDEDENEDCEKVSPWLEAQNEFEFVAFQKDDTKTPTRPNKKKKNRKFISIPKLFSASFLQENISGNSRFKNYLAETSQTPERPSRRRKKTSEPNLGEIN